MPKSSGQLSVVIPCFNEEKTIKVLLETVLIQELVGEVIVIDDCSIDSSIKIVESLGDSRITLLKHDKNKGKGAAIATGLKHSKLPYVIIQDADLEYDPNEYEDLMRPILAGKADVVFGSRFLTSTSRRVLYYWHHVGNSVLTTLSNIFTNIDLTDMETCYKVMTRKVANSLQITENRFGLEPQITAQIAAMRVRIFEIPISYNGRTYEEGKKITWKDGFSALRCIVKYNLPKHKKRARRRYLEA
jgi:glycosyltransferase involved in cell wall biosynthesis